MNGVEKMEARLQKWGNSVGVRIPHNLLKELNIKVNDLINLELLEDKIVITKQLNPKISLKERFDNYKGDNLAKEFTWDQAKGKEIW